jgi:hypothetical protein
MCYNGAADVLLAVTVILLVITNGGDMRRGILIGSWVISWNKTTWKDWLPLLIMLTSLSLFMLAGLVYCIVKAIT